MNKASKKTILLVEDEALIAMSEKVSLERYGYDVAIVRTGEQAVEFFQIGRSVDLVLMDIDLGAGMDGTQAAETILQDHDMPVVFLSSHTEPEIVEKTERITSYGYVVKNSSVTVLDASIKMAFRLFDANKKLTDELSERKRTEDALQESEEKFRALFEKGPIGVAYHEMVYDDAGRAIDYRFLDANSSYRELTGVDPRGKRVTEAFPGIENDPFDWIGTFGRVATTGEQIRFERCLQPNNRWYDCVGYQVKPDHFVAAFVEITKRKQAEDALNASVTQYHELASRIPVGVYVLWFRANGRVEFEYVSDRWCAIHGIRREDAIADADAVNNLVHPEDRESFLECNRKSARERTPFLWEGRFFTGDGDLRQLRIESSPVALENGDIRWFGVTQDITEDKLVENELGLREEYLERVLETTSDGFWVVGSDRRIIHVNSAYCRMSGYCADELTRMEIGDIDAKESQEETVARVSRIIEHGSETFETIHRRKDGSLLNLEVSASRIERSSGTSIVCFCRDITERRLIQQQLLEKNSLLNEVLENMLDLVAITSMDGTFRYAGRSHERLGYSVSSLIGQNVMDYVHPDDLASVTQEFSSFVQSEQDSIVEYRYRCADGSYVWLETAGRLLRNEGGIPSRILFNTRDITERKRVAERLQNAHAINRALFDQALGAVYISDMSGKLIDVNRGACSQSGYSREELLEMTVFDLNDEGVDLRDGDNESILDAWEQWIPGEQHTYEALHVGKDGRRYPVLISTGAILHGNTKAIAGAAMDITELKRAEEQVRTLAAEKETLIREMQHRIKNNINTMTSLLSLQAQTLEEPTAVAAIDDARSRLESLGVLYDHLYATDARGHSSLREYLQQLVASEVDVFPHGNQVVMHSEIEEHLCTSKTLSTLGLIVNELVTNAMKYAFVHHPNPNLTITGVHCDEDYTLTIQDNGPGILKPDESQPSSGFGLMIVKALSEQLDGSIRFEEDGGTVAILRFPVGER